MEDTYSLGVYVMSYNRYDKILTNQWIEGCTYVVRKSQEQKYREAGIERIWAIDDELIDSNIKTYWYIIKNAPEDVVFVADDDIMQFKYRLDVAYPIDDPDTVMDEIYRIAQILVDLNLGYAANDATGVPYGYDGAFAFKGTSGAIKWVNKMAFKAEMDESVKYNYDIDIVLQELLRNRIVIKPRYLICRDFQDTNKGGDSSKKRSWQIDSIHNMTIKWGRYFKYNLASNKPRINVKR